MTTSSHDVQILRDLAKQYAELAAQPIQEERRELWTRCNSLEKCRPIILVGYGVYNVWCRDFFGDRVLKCEDGFYRGHERALRMKLFQATVGDDTIQEPWLRQSAAINRGWENLWGVQLKTTGPGVEGGAYMIDAPIKTWDDMQKMTMPKHVVDEEKTAADVAKLREAVGDILEVDVSRGPTCQAFAADIATLMAQLRGLEQIMIDMYESPDHLHAMAAFMRDGILANQQQAEDAGDWSRTEQCNQAVPYSRELGRPKANVFGCKRSQLWGYCAAQEFTLISPAMHDEFMFQYQLPIMEKFGLMAYGCCEDLTHKIDMLRQAKNLRIIAVAPRADVAKCAEQIGTDYVMSWRPNPADMVCCGFDEDRIRRIVRNAMDAMKGCHVIVNLKDIETVEGDPGRLARWVKIVRSITDEY